MRSFFVVALLGLPAVAHAHVVMTYPPSRADLPNGDPQKIMHCGKAGRIANRVTTLAPGATITVQFKETVNHTGWYRISFQPDGEVFRMPPASNGPNGTGAMSNYPTEIRTGMTDETNAIVLMDRFPDAGDKLAMTMDVTLPNIECSNCTLQLLSVMTNGITYTPGSNGSLYFQCADITLAANAPDAGMVDTGPDAGVDPGGGGSNTGGGGEISGGCSTSNATGLLALVGLLGLRRRRRD